MRVEKHRREIKTGELQHSGKAYSYIPKAKALFVLGQEQEMQSPSVVQK